jgi:hypothetical protein
LPIDNNSSILSAGSATVTILAIIMCLAIIFASIGFIVNVGMLVVSDHKIRFEIKKRLVTKAQEVYALLYEEDDREYDSKFGPLMDYVGGNEDTVQLKDIGSALNPNMIHVELLEWLDTHLFTPPDTLFKDPKNFNAQTIKQFWTDTGIHYNLADYSDYFEENIITSYMTPYTYFNINLTYEFVLEQLFKDRTGSELDAKRFHEGITALLQKLELIYTNEILEKWFTTSSNLILPNVNGISSGQLNFDKMFPVLNCEPQMNVHFVNEEILRAILSYEPFKISDALLKADQIIKMREDPDKKGLTKTDLQNIIGPGLGYPGKRIIYYLGVFTNFWELKVKEQSGENDVYVLRWVIARIPKLKSTDDLKYKIIEEEFYLEGKEQPVEEPVDEAVAEEAAGVTN